MDRVARFAGNSQSQFPIFKQIQMAKIKKFYTIILLVTSYWLLVTPIANAFSQLGASMYITPLSENPRANSNFTATIKVDSLAQPINAVKGLLYFNKDKLEIINISKIGSILNLWLEEPSFSNIEGILRFQGGVPNPGFMGNGGVVLHVIFRAKGSGVNSLVWKEGEVLASDGKGTNILTNLQNLDFFVEESLVMNNSSSDNTNNAGNSLPPWTKILIYSNVALIIIVLFISGYLLSKIIIRVHDRHFHQGEHDEEHEIRHYIEHKEQSSSLKNNEFLRRQEELKE